MTRPSGPQPYADPYLAGVGLGLVLLAAFVLAGRGLGASGAFNTTVAGAVSAVDPALAARNPWFASYVAVDGGPCVSRRGGADPGTRDPGLGIRGSHSTDLR